MTEKKMAKSTKSSQKSHQLIKEIETLRSRLAELEKIEESLRESERRFRDIVENTLEWVWEVDAEGRYTYASPVVKKILGYEPEEVLGRYFYEFFHPEDREKLKKAAFKIFAKKQFFSQFISRNIRKNGKEVWISTNAVPILDENDRLLGYRGSDTDITERKRAEEKFKKAVAAAEAAVEKERKEAAKLKKAYKELEETRDMLIQSEKMSVVGQLASGVAHEVRNPLAIITQGINYLEKKNFSEREILEVLNMMKENVKRADAIIGDIVDFSRKTKLDIEPQPINPILENSLLLTKHKLRMDNIEVIKELKEDLPDVLVDRIKMEQIFVNIFLNAVQAMPHGGKLFVRTYAKQMTERGKKVGSREADYFRVGELAVVVEIEDTGTGIPPKHQKKIFDPFFTTKGPKGGTGLGLSITMNIVALHKGLIEMESEQGKGTKVIVTLKTRPQSIGS